MEVGTFRVNLKGRDLGVIRGGSQDQVAQAQGSSQNCPCLCTALTSLARKVLGAPHVHSFTHSKSRSSTHEPCKSDTSDPSVSGPTRPRLQAELTSGPSQCINIFHSHKLPDSPNHRPPRPGPPPPAQRLFYPLPQTHLHPSQGEAPRLQGTPTATWGFPAQPPHQAQGPGGEFGA